MTERIQGWSGLGGSGAPLAFPGLGLDPRGRSPRWPPPGSVRHRFVSSFLSPPSPYTIFNMSTSDTPEKALSPLSDRELAAVDGVLKDMSEDDDGQPAVPITVARDVGTPPAMFGAGGPMCVTSVPPRRSLHTGWAHDILIYVPIVSQA